jgi:signal transduction histidine kinase
MQQFEILLKNEKIKQYNQIGWFIIAINCLFVLFLAIFSLDRKMQISNIVILVCLLIVFLLERYFRKSSFKFGIHPYFFLLMIFWLNLEMYWLAAFIFVFDLLYTIATRRLLVSFKRDKITWPGVFLRKIKWVDLTNTVLKDGLLTVDFKNNKILQQFIDEKSNTVNEKEFNDFCKSLITPQNPEDKNPEKWVDAIDHFGSFISSIDIK